jgi:3-phytase
MRALGKVSVAQATGLCILACLSACAVSTEGDEAGHIEATAETARVAGSGDAADDPAIWVAPDPSQSLILGTDKTLGLYVFDLDGQIRQFLAAGRLNNVDLRDGFIAGGRQQVLVIATDRTTVSLAVFLLDPTSGTVMAAPGGLIPLDIGDPYGACLTQMRDGRFMAAVTGAEGELRQVQIAAGPNGQIVSRVVRRMQLESIAEGCVFDDRTGDLYVAEEERGIWRLPADPAHGDELVLVHPVDNDALVADVEGLAIYAEGEDDGWLIASSQGDSAYALFALPGGRYIHRVRIGGGLIDAVTGTDGLEATSRPLPGYPRGIIVVQDDKDDSGGQNFKIVDWHEISNALGLEAIQPPQ